MACNGSKNELSRPTPYVIAGPNGAGKTTFAKKLLPGHVHCREFAKTVELTCDEVQAHLARQYAERMAAASAAPTDQNGAGN